MKTLIFLILPLFLVGTLRAQSADFTPPRLVKTAIGASGCHAYLPDDAEIAFDVSYSPDSSVVYTGDFASGDFHYAVIVVKLNNMVLETLEEKQAMLTSYLDFLQSEFSITESAGYGMGHTLTAYPDATGVLDYWEDADLDEWTVKAWADGSTMAVMAVYGATDYPSYSALEVYLNGFRFD